MAGFDNEVMFATGERLEPSSAQEIIIMQQTANDVSRINYNSDPEGLVSANPSSFCHDRTAGNVYIKQTGTGNTGWAQISTGSASPLVVVSAYLSTDITNATGDGTAFNPIMDSTFTNVGTSYNTSTGVFTAPVAGNYMYTLALTFTGVSNVYNRGWIITQTFPSNNLSSFFNIGSIYDVVDLAGTVFQNGIVSLIMGQELQFECSIFGGTKTLSVQGVSAFGGFSSSLGITQLR